MNVRDFYKGKKVLVTGSTGFKGTWLCEILHMVGAQVTGYALKPPATPAVYDILNTEKRIHQIYGDIRELSDLRRAFEYAMPEIVFHLAAQPIVRTSYKEPVYTYATNVMGTVNICECIRESDTVKSFVNVTTDKVYKNEEYEVPFTEDMPLDGRDPYSNSKSCSELVTHSYARSFLTEKGIAVSTVRAGNVIGGGDFADDRIIPDCVRAAYNNEKIVIRNPYSIRPYQHVLEPLYAYLQIAMVQWHNREKQGSYNVGPDESGCITTGALADKFCAVWGQELSWINRYDGGPYEAGFLKLNCDKLKKEFGELPRISVDETIKLTADWYRNYGELKASKDVRSSADTAYIDVKTSQMLDTTISQIREVYGW